VPLGDRSGRIEWELWCIDGSHVRAHRIGAVIPERTVGWLKEARRVATRFEKLAVHYLAALELAVLEQYVRASLSQRT
jgi:hypothetical protein